MSDAAADVIAFVKGHGTGNDFVLLPDVDGSLDLTPGLTAAICDRRTGIGADGVLRVVRSMHAADPDVVAQAGAAEWFMDYRNADGSLAEMCGNGIRVLARHLLDEGLALGPVLPIATRAGVAEIHVLADGMLSARLGPLAVPEQPVQPYVSVGQHRWAAAAVTMPNPHAVVFVDDLAEAGPLHQPPTIDPAEFFPEGANVEFVQIIEAGHLAMRVHERGVGETRSCGTGACAAVAAARRSLAPKGEGIARVWNVDVPGGRLTVTENPDATMDLAGPAVLVGSGLIVRAALNSMAD